MKALKECQNLAEFHTLNAVKRQYIPKPIKTADRTPIINSFRIKMSNPIPIRTMPIFAINFYDCLALKLKNEFVLNNSIM